MTGKGVEWTEPERRSLELVRSIVEANPWAEFVLESKSHIRIRVKGQSLRWYLVEARLRGPTPQEAFFQLQRWQYVVTGGARRRDVVHTNRYTAQLCLNTRQSSTMPFGDKVAALCLSLHNDLITAMTIPLLAQFIVCPREELSKIMVFQDEMVVYYSMFDDEIDHNPPFMDFEQGAEPMFGGSDFGHTPEESPTGQQPDEEPLQPDPPSLREEELEEMRLWEAYERHMEDLARRDEWNNRHDEDRR
jgi:hypothetical protein